eukprot:1259986-Pyramimonas_sp.AAC.1
MPQPHSSATSTFKEAFARAPAHPLGKHKFSNIFMEFCQAGFWRRLQTTFARPCAQALERAATRVR